MRKIHPPCPVCRASMPKSTRLFSNRTPTAAMALTARMTSAFSDAFRTEAVADGFDLSAPAAAVDVLMMTGLTSGESIRSTYGMSSIEISAGERYSRARGMERLDCRPVRDARLARVCSVARYGALGPENGVGSLSGSMAFSAAPRPFLNVEVFPSDGRIEDAKRPWNARTGRERYFASSHSCPVCTEVEMESWKCNHSYALLGLLRNVSS